ncbi:DNA adenine methylase [Xenorhabdus szentirmaii]|uniref:Site-specific DNA-methyltransferase (adenine-specific) n=1 Tax=Xenorhabdus szentirmaii DSM 16338 TaxID=1427518 RepID=W1J316_9GAMM|nr:Dam family site-specific DNA-(adenine-N6)-methyltransferase [Xenorhabdus szentirmaii]PHM32052.1 DNA adenine methylase [Xenorhabdus szentirmaii DSM 16338]CDL83855.1 Retron EC67 DNA adenine methylase [Xenorhabdus szentirmaii DSM 16338]
MANKTILKWAGSKVRIMDKLLPHLPAGKRLVEPFAGSCAVMMNTNYDAYFIADINQDLIRLYQVILWDDERFIRDAKEYFENSNHQAIYYSRRAGFNGDAYTSEYLKSLLFLYLNRHAYNGLCRYNQQGKFNVPYGKHKTVYFPEKEIREFHQKWRKAKVACLEWQDTLTLVDHGDVVYCDPPYLTENGAFTQYHQSTFTQTDHEALAADLYTLNVHLGVPVTVSNSIEAKTLYADLGFTIHEIAAPRSIAANGNRQPVKEIIAVLERRHD